MTERLVLVFVIACLAGLAAVLVPGSVDDPLEGDGLYFLHLGQSLASGKGYLLDFSHWPQSPQLGRLPLWPATLSPALWLSRNAASERIARYGEVLMHAIASGLLALITYAVWRSVNAAVIAGFFFALYPPELALLRAGYSEPVYFVAAFAGLLLMIRGRLALGAVVSGIAVLGRSNYTIMPLLFGVAVALFRPALLREWRRGVVLAVLFLIPVSLWVLRNYLVSGAFPIINALEGETMYGGNNALVANDLRNWGYWTFPDHIPGQMRQKDVAQSLTEAQINSYYRRKAIEFARQNWLAYPRLLLGKMVRGFVPVPFVPSASSYAASLFRWLLYGLVTWALLSGFRPPDPFRLYLVAMTLLLLITTLVFYGTFRFTLTLEAFLVPCVAAFLAQRWNCL